MGFFVKVMVLHVVERDVNDDIYFSICMGVHMAFEQFRLGEDAVFRCFLL